MASHRTTRSPAWETLCTVLGRAIRRMHRIVGAPDYDTYMEHVRRCHPDHAPLTQDEFFRQRLDDRYNNVGSRCC